MPAQSTPFSTQADHYCMLVKPSEVANSIDNQNSFVHFFQLHEPPFHPFLPLQC